MPAFLFESIFLADTAYISRVLASLMPDFLTAFPYHFLHSYYYFIRFLAHKVSAIVYLADGLECRCLQLRPASTIADLIEHMLQVGRCQATPSH